LTADPRCSLPHGRTGRSKLLSRNTILAAENTVSHRFYAIVWIDHREAEVFHLSSTEESKVVINSHSSVQRLHQRSHADGTQHQAIDTDFFARIVSALNHTGGTLLAGPGEAKHDLERYIRGNRPDLGAHVQGIETVGHPGDEELIAIARDHFRLAA
jgi:stalled ribosome rescue protein Dom34